MDRTVFGVAAAISTAFVVWGVLDVRPRRDDGQCGNGHRLMFFAVAEPVTPPDRPAAGTELAGTEGAAQQAMALSYFHWALHPWAIYAVVGLAIAYFSFRRGLPSLISSAFYPLLGERIHGPIGKSIDILAIFATLFGSATRLGLGALQINSGFDSCGGGAGGRGRGRDHRTALRSSAP